MHTLADHLTSLPRRDQDEKRWSTWCSNFENAVRNTGVPESSVLGKRDLNSWPGFTQATKKTEVHEVKLAAAGADCKRCLDVQSSLVKELCLWIRVDRDQRRLERRQDLQLKLLREVSSGHELRWQLQFSSWKPFLCLQTDIVELNALRCEIQQLQGCNNDASASLACLCRMQNETFDARIRKCKVGRSSRSSARSRWRACRPWCRCSARSCPGSVARTSSDHEERWVACEQSNVPLAHNVASRETRTLIPSSSVCTSWEGRCRRSFQSSRVQRMLTKQQGTFCGRCKIVFRVVAVNRMQQSNEWRACPATVVAR